MVVRAVEVRVVGELVVVPDAQHRVLAVELLQIGIAAVLRVPRSVVVRRERLVRWLVGARQIRIVVGPGAVLVDVVAEVDDGVDVVATRHLRVAGEEAEREVRAAHDAEAK